MRLKLDHCLDLTIPTLEKCRAGSFPPQPVRNDLIEQPWLLAVNSPEVPRRLAPRAGLRYTAQDPARATERFRFRPLESRQNHTTADRGAASNTAGRRGPIVLRPSKSRLRTHQGREPPRSMARQFKRVSPVAHPRVLSIRRKAAWVSTAQRGAESSGGGGMFCIIRRFAGLRASSGARRRHLPRSLRPRMDSGQDHAGRLDNRFRSSRAIPTDQGDATASGTCSWGYSRGASLLRKRAG